MSSLKRRVTSVRPAAQTAATGKTSVDSEVEAGSWDEGTDPPDTALPSDTALLEPGAGGGFPEVEALDAGSPLTPHAPDALAGLTDRESDPSSSPIADVTEGWTGDTTTRAIVPVRRAAVVPDEADSSQVDLLTRYMRSIAHLPLLAREEEVDIARRYRATGDMDLARRLVSSNLRLVVKIAWEYRRAAFNLLDLVQEGNVGLVQGVQKFDPDRGVRLSSYAAWWIRAYIIRYIMDNWRMVKLGTTQAQRKIFFNLRKEKERLTREGFDPEPRLLAQRLDVPEQDVVEMEQRLSGEEAWLDAPTHDDSSQSLGDRLADPAVAVDDQIATEELQQVFRRHLDDFGRTLTDKEQFIFEHRLVAENPLTLQEVGDRYGMSRERARQIEARLMNRLREFMRDRIPDFDLLSSHRSPEGRS